ncbi:MAG: GTP cyclohydrolase II [Reyranellaceae bacterium]
MASQPAPIAPTQAALATPLVGVERAMAELRRGGIVALRDPSGHAALIAAAEGLGNEVQRRVSALCASSPYLLLTEPRARTLAIDVPPHLLAQIRETNTVALAIPTGVAAEIVADVADPRADPKKVGRHFSRPVAPPSSAVARAAIELSKLARLLPAVLMGPLAIDRKDQLRQWAREQDLIYVDTAAIALYEELAAQTLQPVADARVPLEGAENARIVAWRPRDGGKEHLAIVIGDIDPTEPVLIRLHSECFTGDLLASLRCDCGEQLRGAIAEIARAGSGVLLYLAQEGRGIGLVNKLRAYQLQDGGFDTIDANEQLGYDADERLYRPAAVILSGMGISRVRLMTNNPQKMGQLGQYGIEVVERVRHVFPANGHNENYLRTKATRAGHML